jgi:hypothetical protein
MGHEVLSVPDWNLPDRVDGDFERSYELRCGLAPA